MFMTSHAALTHQGHFADNIFKCIFLNENVWFVIKISLKFAPEGIINNIPALVQMMAWRRPGDKPLSEPMMTQFNDAYMRHSSSMSGHNELTTFMLFNDEALSAIFMIKYLVHDQILFQPDWQVKSISLIYTPDA